MIARGIGVLTVATSKHDPIEFPAELGDSQRHRGASTVTGRDDVQGNEAVVVVAGLAPVHGLDLAEVVLRDVRPDLLGQVAVLLRMERSRRPKSDPVVADDEGLVIAST